ncbi:MAG: hypothetical protein V1913_14935, partial [Fibrobacterota bacterium]
MTKTGGPAVEERETKKALDATARTCRDLLAKGKPLAPHIKDRDLAALQERYSRFEDRTDNEGYVIDSLNTVHRPLTPRPYFHALHNFQISGRAYGTLWDQSGRGFSYLSALRGGGVTRNVGSPYKPLYAAEKDQRAFYLREKNAGGVYADDAGDKLNAWSLFPLADSRACHYTDFRCTQSRSFVSLEAVKQQVAAALTVMVPMGRCAEVWKLSLKNLSQKKRDLDLFVRVDWSLLTYPASRLNRGEFYHAEFQKKLSALLVRNVDITDKNPRTAFLATDAAITGFEFSGERFDAPFSCDLTPGAVIQGVLSSSDSAPVGEPPISGLHIRVTLPAGGAKTFFFALGAAAGTDADACKEIDALKKGTFSEKGFASALAAA